MYQNIKSKVFTSKYMKKDTMYEISACPGCIRVRPYYGSYQFDWLRWCDSAMSKVYIPVEALRISGLHDKAYVIEEDEMFYLIEPTWYADPSVFTFPSLPMFHFAVPVAHFYDEAASIPMEALSPISANTHYNTLPKTLREQAGIMPSDPVAISVFSEQGKSWITIRPASDVDSVHLHPQENRITSAEFIPELSGITVLSKAGKMAIKALLPSDDWNYRHLVGWYSQKEKAIIIEREPIQCTVCGASIRSTAMEHFTARVCTDCKPHLGPEKAIHAIMTAQNAIHAAEDVLKTH